MRCPYSCYTRRRFKSLAKSRYARLDFAVRKTVVVFPSPASVLFPSRVVKELLRAIQGPKPGRTDDIHHDSGNQPSTECVLRISSRARFLSAPEILTRPKQTIPRRTTPLTVCCRDDPGLGDCNRPASPDRRRRIRGLRGPSRTSARPSPPRLTHLPRCRWHARPVLAHFPGGDEGRDGYDKAPRRRAVPAHPSNRAGTERGTGLRLHRDV